MSLKLSETPCKKSPKNRPCVMKFLKTQLMGEGIRKSIYRCKRCLEIHLISEDATKLECPLSPSGKHQWEWSETLAFKQHWRHQEKTVNENCPLCSAEREKTYQTPIGYNPHR